ncbi:hepatic and glial cell adhesion molecule-like isoform X3 [Heterodontus francisci]|uniref:hepatic and glial cell adhesion molecule-like isoform X3 n=1 Tax=Heterodontus francisci TaxID=7792 RepID=UPI00355B7705
MELQVHLPLLLLLQLINAEGGMKEVFGVVGSSVLLDPEYGADLSNSDVIWMFTGSSGKPVTILDYVPNHPKAEPSEQFKSRLYFNVSGGSLMLNSLKASDQGVYTITVDEDWKRSKDLKLTEPLSDPLIFSNSTCVETTIELTCQVSAGKVHSVLWRKGDEVITNGQHYQLVQKDNKLIISKARKSDCGIYTCTVENAVSKKNSSYSLSIYDLQLTENVLQVLHLILLIAAFVCWIQIEGAAEIMVYLVFLCPLLTLPILSTCTIKFCDNKRLNNTTKFCHPKLMAAASALGEIIVIYVSGVLIVEIKKQADKGCEPTVNLQSSIIPAVVVPPFVFFAVFIVCTIRKKWRASTLSAYPSVKDPDEHHCPELKEPFLKKHSSSSLVTNLNPGA